jgi:DNA-binding transcriptional ArsR family regulator
VAIGATSARGVRLRSGGSMPTASSRVRIAALLAGGRALTATEIARRVKVTRPVATRHLGALVKQGQVLKEESGRTARYRIATSPAGASVARAPTNDVAVSEETPTQVTALVRRYPRAVISEDRVWQELVGLVPALSGLTPSAAELFRYALTEMLNNAIVHSDSDEVEVRVEPVGDETLVFEVRDDGVGLFRSLRQRLGLASDQEALEKLAKGKLPPMPSGRAGAGIFFTSQAGRRFEVESAGFRWLVDNRADQSVTGSASARKGTRVLFEGELQPRRTLAQLFAQHNEHAAFPRSRVVVTLATGSISRSEAQQLLARLERFSTVVLDFKDVKEIGQAFADEVFRVWPSSHPNVSLEPINMSPMVTFMVDHARRIR